jgi:hypothetical protein
MKISCLLFLGLFLLSLSSNIIRDLPYNIYHVENMDQYKNKYIDEGNKFYIRFPSNFDNDVKFYLTIPKNITLFPIYSSEFNEYPSDKEIIKTDFKNEISLKNREDLQYSIYTFDLENTSPYKVLYFQNNELLNYISFYAFSNSSNTSNIKDLNFDRETTLTNLKANTSYYYRVKIDGKKDKFEIKIQIPSRYIPSFQLDVKGFTHYPTDEEASTVDINWIKSLPYESKISSGNEVRTYDFNTGEDVDYLAIRIYFERDLPQMQIKVSVDSSLPTWAIVLISIAAVIVLAFITCCCMMTEAGRAFCEVFLACLQIFAICAACCK